MPDQLLSAAELASMVESVEAEAYADMMRLAPAGLDMRVERLGSVTLLLAPHLPTILVNRVLGLGLAEPVTQALLDEIMAIVRQAGTQTFAAQICPLAQPSTIPQWLEERGLLHKDNWAKVYRPATSPPQIATSLRIECIGIKHATEFALAACTAFQMPPHLAPWLAAGIGQPGWFHYAAFDGDQVVATGALFVYGDVGWLGVGSTLPSHRRRGAQGALMARRIQDGIKLGCHWLITETGEDRPEHPNPSYHNMVRTGFELAYQRPNFIASFTA